MALKDESKAQIETGTAPHVCLKRVTEVEEELPADGELLSLVTPHALPPPSHPTPSLTSCSLEQIQKELNRLQPIRRKLAQIVLSQTN